MRADAVQHDLERLTLADAARVDDLPAEDAEHGPHALDRADRAADERDELALSGGAHRAAHRRVDEARAVRLGAPRPAAIAASRPIVDMSTRTGRGFRCSCANVASTPSRPSSTDASASASLSIVMTTSAPSAHSRGVLAGGRAELGERPLGTARPVPDAHARARTRRGAPPWAGPFRRGRGTRPCRDAWRGRGGPGERAAEVLGRPRR